MGKVAVYKLSLTLQYSKKPVGKEKVKDKSLYEYRYGLDLNVDDVQCSDALVEKKDLGLLT